MECGKYMNRKAYKMTLGLLYLLSLIALELWFLYACGILHGGMGLEGTDAIVIPLLPLWLASGVTALVWIFLRLSICKSCEKPLAATVCSQLQVTFQSRR